MARKARTSNSLDTYPRENVDLIFRALDYTTDGIVLGALDGRILYHNKAWLDIHGMDENVDLRGKVLRDTERKELGPILDKIRAETMKRGSFTYQFGTVRRDGKYHDLSVSTSILPGLKPPVFVTILREVTEVVQAQKALERHNEELTVFNEIHRVISSARDEKSVVRHMQRLIMDFIGASASGFYSIDVAGNRATLIDSIGLPPELRKRMQTIPIKGTVVGLLLRAKGVYIHSRGARRAVKAQYRVTEQMGLGNAIGFLFKTGGKRVYAAIYGTRRTGKLPLEVRHFLGAASAQFGFALERVEFLEELASRQRELESRNQELAVLNKIHRIMATSESRRAVVERTQRALMNFIGASASGLYEVDPTKDYYELVHSIGLPPKLRAQVKHVPVGLPIFTRILRSKGPTVVEEDMRGRLASAYDIRRRLKFARTIGIVLRTDARRDYLAIFGIGQTRRNVTPQTRSILAAAASQFGLRLGRIDLVEELQRRQVELERRNKELAVLNKIHRIMTTSRSRQAVIRPMQKLLMDFMGSTSASVFQVDRTKKYMVRIDSIGLPARLRKVVDRVPTDEPIISQILRTKGVFVVEEDMSAPPASKYDIRHAVGSRRTIAFVFRTGGKYDYLVLYSVTKENIDVTSEVRSVLDAAATQFGLALGRIDFLEELERGNLELQAREKVYTIISTAPTRESLIRQILKVAMDFVGARAAVLLEIDRVRDRVVLVDSLGTPQSIVERIRRLPTSHRGFAWMVHSRGVVVVEEDLPAVVAPPGGIRKALGIKRTIACAFSAGNAHDYQIVLGLTKDEDVSPETREFFEYSAKRFGLGIERRDLIDSLSKSQRELKELTTRLIASGEEDRRQLARLLHDDLGQTIAGLRYEVDGLERMLEAPNSCARKSLDAIRKQLLQVSQSTRNVSRSLHPSMLDELGLIPALTWYIDNFVRGEQLEVEFEDVGFDKRLPHDVELALYRSAQECLTNIVRHAEASHVKIGLTKGYPRVIMVIEDDGKGISTRKGKPSERGLGLVSMRERAQLMGGTLEIRSRRGKGTRVRVEIPIRGSHGGKD